MAKIRFRKPDGKCVSPSAYGGNAYEALRQARIAENQARMAALGVHKQAGDLKEFFRVTKTPRKPKDKLVLQCSPVRRSQRLKDLTPPAPSTEFRRSERFAKRNFQTPPPDPKKENDYEEYSPKSTRNSTRNRFEENGERRPANAPLPRCSPADLQLSPELLAQRCYSKTRGSVYDPILGICCHFCRYLLPFPLCLRFKKKGRVRSHGVWFLKISERWLLRSFKKIWPSERSHGNRQKKLCGEEDCSRCGDRDVTKPCLGKTDCSICHSSTGVFCRACLKIRYGEDIEEVRQNKDWVCPHCSEMQGTNPYWICNSSLCLKKRNIPPTGIAIFTAREMGYKSVAHYLVDVLKKKGFSG